ncbi:MAG TPA: YqaA family protein [Alphaproteobacteria bacterium]|nr:YqaA family protein [Alphaproteobacteria bacterium]
MKKKRSFGEKIMSCARHKHATTWMVFISFIESSFFPFPPDLLIVAMLMADRTKAWALAFYATISSVLGGMLGYAIGFFLFETLGEWIIKTYSLQEAFIRFQHDFQEWGFWIISLKGLTPIPFKLVTIASGVAQLDFKTFVLASIIARSFRFYLLSALMYFFGPAATEFIQKYLTLVLVATLVILVAGFVIVKYIAS